MSLRTNYKYPKWLGKKKYSMTYNSDNTVSFTDVTNYIESGDYLNATDFEAPFEELGRFYNKYSGWIQGSAYPGDPNYRDATFTGKKKFIMTENGDDTVSFEDVTEYIQSGSTVHASELNGISHSLNTLPNAFDTTMTAIENKLRELGATNPSNILGSIDQLGKVNNDRGKEAGRQAVLTNPHSYYLYTKAEYDVYANKSTRLRNAKTTAKGRINTVLTNHPKENGQLANSLDVNSSTYSNQIVTGMSKSSAQSVVNQAVASLNSIITSIVAYKNKYVNEATSIKNYLESQL